MVDPNQAFAAVTVLFLMLAITIIVPVMAFRHRMQVIQEREDKAYAKGVRYFNHMNETEFEGRLLHLAVCVVKANDDLTGSVEQSNYAEGVLDAFLEFFKGNPEEGQVVLDNLHKARQMADELKKPSDVAEVKKFLIGATRKCEDHECSPSLSYMIGRINKEQENDSR